MLNSLLKWISFASVICHWSDGLINFQFIQPHMHRCEYSEWVRTRVKCKQWWILNSDTLKQTDFNRIIAQKIQPSKSKGIPSKTQRLFNCSISVVYQEHLEVFKLILSKICLVPWISFISLNTSQDNFYKFHNIKEGRASEVFRWFGPYTRDRWPHCKILNENFWAKTDEVPISVLPPFEHTEEE